MYNVNVFFQIDEDNVVFVGGIILRHITQLVCNASAIYEVKLEALVLL